MSETIDFEANQHIMDELEAAIKETFEKGLQGKMIFPQEQILKIGQDIIKMSLDEPCGIRGCVVYIQLVKKDQAQTLAKLFTSHSITPTFEIFLTLREDERSWRKLQTLYITIRDCICKNKRSAAPKLLHPSYKLEKRRLYRS